mgnify:CR=1 FL=1
MLVEYYEAKWNLIPLSLYRAEYLKSVYRRFVFKPSHLDLLG